MSVVFTGVCVGALELMGQGCTISEGWGRGEHGVFGHDTTRGEEQVDFGVWGCGWGGSGEAYNDGVLWLASRGFEFSSCLARSLFLSSFPLYFFPLSAWFPVVFYSVFMIAGGMYHDLRVLSTSWGEGLVISLHLIFYISFIFL